MNEWPKVTIQMVGWNSRKHLETTLPRLVPAAQSGARLCFIDNGSEDGSAEFVRGRLPAADIIELNENVGYARAHNIGLKKCITDYVLIIDPDMALQWEGVVELLGYFSDPHLAAVQGKLLRPGSGYDRTIDSTGIVLTRALNGCERGAFEPDRRQYDVPSAILGPTGACALYRMQALKKVAYANAEIFDESFFSYKEDVDLNWRLTRAGFKSMYYPVLVGDHHRTLGRRGFLNWGLHPRAIWQRARNPRTYYSIRNWAWMVAKNAGPGQLGVALPFICVRVGALFMVSLLYPPLLRVWPALLKGLPAALRRRGLPLGKA